MRAARNGLSGRLHVPGWGANTMRTEFAVLTGIPESALGYDRFNPYYGLARVPIELQVWRLRRAGYRTICLHPFDRRFFRRDLAMPALGFERFLGRETLGGARRPPYQSDPELAGHILRTLDAEGPRDLHLRDHDGQSRPVAGGGPAGRPDSRRAVRPGGDPGRGGAAALPRRTAPVRRDAADCCWTGWSGAAGRRCSASTATTCRAWAAPLPISALTQRRAITRSGGPTARRSGGTSSRTNSAGSSSTASSGPPKPTTGSRAGRLPRAVGARKLAAMSAFVPPYPERPRQPLPPLAMFAAARRNFLEVFEDKCFEYQFFSTRLLNRRLFVCNSPDTVAQAFIALHESFERKTPQMRHALFPLVGDGLIISDGETWKTPPPHRRADRACARSSACSRRSWCRRRRRWPQRWDALPDGARIDVLREMGTLTAEVICRAVFGPRLGTEHASEIAASFSEYQRLVGTPRPAVSGRAAGLGAAPAFLADPPSRRRRIHAVLDHIIEQCRERHALGESSMIRLLLEARDPETGAALDDAALRNEAAVLFLAGEETTANSLAWTWYLLSQAPEVESAAACRAGERSRRPPADPG